MQVKLPRKNTGTIIQNADFLQENIENNFDFVRIPTTIEFP